MRLAGALVALLGGAEGVELPEDELLGLLREAGLITYPATVWMGRPADLHSDGLEFGKVTFYHAACSSVQ